MRIVAGKYRGKKLFTPDYEGVRPTSERAREALFSILYSRLGGFSGCKALDILPVPALSDLKRFPAGR